ncbi:MAG: sugar nucleotide-binding protein, partial [Opitutales bacterium]|nr:sugar nucleotide-binding protein [Opitutales bacterium]
WDINIVALANAVNLFRGAKCLYYASTDSVYGEGSKDKKFVETDKCAPVNLYGKQKALAEQICLAKGFNVVRFPFIFGTSLVEGRPHFFDKIKADLASGKPVEMFSDSYRSTLSFDQCARYLVALIEKFGSCPEKIVNIAGDDAMSKYDAALVLAEKYGLNKDLIEPVSVASTSGIFKAKRAASGTLDNSKLKALLNIKEIHLEV